MAAEVFSVETMAALVFGLLSYFSAAAVMAASDLEMTDVTASGSSSSCSYAAILTETVVAAAVAAN